MTILCRPSSSPYSSQANVNGRNILAPLLRCLAKTIIYGALKYALSIMFLRPFLSSQLARGSWWYGFSDLSLHSFALQLFSFSKECQLHTSILKLSPPKVRSTFDTYGACGHLG